MRAAFLLFLPLMAGAGITPAHSQDPLTNALPAMRKAYEDCFYNSAEAQIRAAQPFGVDINMVSELAFQACRSEEAAIHSLISIRLRPGPAADVMLGKRLQLKRQLQDIAKDPQKYMAR